jgi:hypothetical protein
MRILSIITLIAGMSALGCQPQQTNIVRTAKLPDGTEVSYSNTSSGYFFNPNYTNDPGLFAAGPSGPLLGAAIPAAGPVCPMPYGATGFPPYGPGCMGSAVVVPDYGGWGR